ncbi:hypothetical protein V865_004907 [Kwoniella europaea PYCC6329]|uniref:Uncharacterized protein n=1 Tax=Kwoniella europaea PYCC6329 TaxID=1423913 RepID=A0AAX4KK53_9TREE
MHSSSFSSPESGPSSQRLVLTSSSPTNTTESGYSSDPEHEQGSESPTESETSIEEFSPESKPVKLPSDNQDVKPLASRYPKIFANPPLPPAPSSRPNRIRGLSPLTSVNTTSNSPSSAMEKQFQPRLPKSQPLSRALFNRSLSDPAPHAQAGIFGGVGKKKTSQKVIVPTKSFRTTFELGLSASELARRA